MNGGYEVLLVFLPFLNCYSPVIIHFMSADRIRCSLSYGVMGFIHVLSRRSGRRSKEVSDVFDEGESRLHT